MSNLYLKAFTLIELSVASGISFHRDAYRLKRTCSIDLDVQNWRIRRGFDLRRFEDGDSGSGVGATPVKACSRTTLNPFSILYICMISPRVLLSSIDGIPIAASRAT